MHVLRYSDYAKNRQNETILRRNLEIAYNKLSSIRQTIGRGGGGGATDAPAMAPEVLFG